MIFETINLWREQLLCLQLINYFHVPLPGKSKRIERKATNTSRSVMSPLLVGTGKLAVILILKEFFKIADIISSAKNTRLV